MTQTKSILINPLTENDQNFLDNPYPHLAALRNEAPVWWCADSKYWIVSEYADVQTVFKSNTYGKQIHRWKHSPSSFVANFIPSLKFLRQIVAGWLLNLNPPDHSRVRGLVSKAFTPGSIEKLKVEIESLANLYAEELSSKNTPVDLIENFAFPFPLAVIGLILGIPLTDRAKLRAWSNQIVGLIGGQRDVKKLMAAGAGMKQFSQYLKPHIESRRARPTDDLLSVLVQAREDNATLSMEELLATSILLLVAGFETTVNLICNSIICLDKFPAQAQLFKNDPSLAENVVKEVLRYESPAQTAPRLAEENTTLGGQSIKKGDMLWLMLGSANRDQKQFSDADTFDIRREVPRNLAFGDGIHRCVGASLAEMEVAIALRVLYQKLPDLKVARPVQYRSPFGMRGPKELYVNWSR